jgi:peptide/nickel transport system ATP-binding protein/oligopeptide transport system ATP-binding protein
MMFQDPAESLNPRMSVGEIITEPMVIQKIGTPVARRERAIELLERVGLAASAVDKFSFEFSGGQRQRIGIARAIALQPELLVLDEPVSALDVSVQSQVLNLLMELQDEMGIAYMFIAHDLAVVKHISDNVAVMYLGKVVEIADADIIYKNPKHAYTKALISAIPVPDPTYVREHVILEGDVPSPIDPPKGSAFGHRLNHPKYEETVGLDLSLVEIEPDHWVAADPCCLEEEDYIKARSLL